MCHLTVCFDPLSISDGQVFIGSVRVFAARVASLFVFISNNSFVILRSDMWTFIFMTRFQYVMTLFSGKSNRH